MLKEQLLRKLNQELSVFENQKESDEYVNVKNVINDIQNLDLSKLEEKAKKFTVNGANAWLKLWTNGTKKRVYLNVAYQNGYRPNMKDNFIEY